MPKREKQRQIAPYSVSQNFLTGKKTIERLLRRTDLNQTDTVLEIGAGKGHLTLALAGVCKNVISYEIDDALYRKLAVRVPENVRLFHRDFLRCRLPNHPYKVFANLPFSRTTEILRKLTQAATLPTAMWLVMEKGAAKRFCGIAGENRHSLQIKALFDCRIAYYFQREDFHPAPRVDAVLLELRRKEVPELSPKERKTFAAFLSYSFRHGLFSAQALLTKRQIAAALKQAGLPQIGPSGDVLYVQWLCLFRCWEKMGKRIPGWKS